MEDWWAMILQGSRRDQLSINFVLWKNGLSYAIIPSTSRRNSWLFLMGHRPATLEDALHKLAQKERELLELQVAIEEKTSKSTIISEVEPPEGLEPPTRSLQNCRSTN